MRRIILSPIIIFFLIICMYPFRAEASSFSVTPGILTFDHVAPDVTYTATLHVYGIEKSKGDFFSVSIDDTAIQDWISTEIRDNTGAGLDVSIKLKVGKAVQDGTYSAHILLVKQAGESSAVVKQNTIEQINQIPIHISVSSEQGARFKLNSISYAGAFRNIYNQHVILSFATEIQNIGGLAGAPSIARLRLSDHASGELVGAFDFNEFKKIHPQDSWSGVLEFDVSRAFGFYDAEVVVYDAQGAIDQGTGHVLFDIPFDLNSKTYNKGRPSVISWILSGSILIAVSICIYFVYKRSHKHAQYEKK